MFGGKAVIGLVGGIGSGKTFVARMLGELGCCVLSADEHVSEAYNDPVVRGTIRQWWGAGVVREDGSVDRAAIADRVFNDESERRRLEELLHPLATAARRRMMEARRDDSAVRAFVLDVPLLVETGQIGECDAIVYVEAPEALRRQRVADSRGWDAGELARREKLQAALDKKRAISEYTVVNTADAGSTRDQVEDVLSRILATSRPG